MSEVKTACLNVMTIDVEDYYHAQALAPFIPKAEIDSLPSHVGDNTNKILDTLDTHNVKASFFVLGCVAQRHPELIRRIAQAGHELASHGWNHTPAYRQSPHEFRRDIATTKSMIEDISGTRVIGYRAPTFSITPGNMWAYDVLIEEGYKYSSSVFPIHHDYYGIPNAPRTPFRPTHNQ